MHDEVGGARKWERRRDRKTVFKSVDAERTPTIPVVDDRGAANPTANHTTLEAEEIEAEYDPPLT